MGLVCASVSSFAVEKALELEITSVYFVYHQVSFDFGKKMSTIDSVVVK